MLGLTYFLPGWFVGAVAWGAIADRVGRRPAFLASLVLAGSLCALASTAPSFPVYAALRCLIGFNMGGNGVVAYVLGAEGLSQAWVDLVGVGFYHFVFALAEAGLVLVAYYIRGWRALTLVTSGFAFVVLLLSYRYLTESPRWLISHGRNAEAVALLEFAAKTNGVTLPEGAIEAIGGSVGGSAGSSSSASDASSSSSSSAHRLGDEIHRARPKKGIWVLFSTPRMLLITMSIGFVWLVCGMIYYGVNNSGTFICHCRVEPTFLTESQPAKRTTFLAAFISPQ